MNGKTVVWVLGQALLWFALGVAAAQLSRTLRQERGREGEARATARQLEALDLDDEQVRAIDRVLRQYEERVREENRRFWEQVREVEAEADRSIRELLDEEQRRRYDDLVTGVD